VFYLRHRGLFDKWIATILSGGGRLEAPPASQYPTAAWSDIKRTPIRSGFRVDGQRKYQRVHREGPVYKPRRACASSLNPVVTSLMYRLVGWCCEWVEVYARPPCRPWGSEGGTRFPQIERLHVSHSSEKANILVNRDRRACIADFGLSTITGVTTYTTAGLSQVSLISNDTLMSFTGGGTRRWMSPELLDPERFKIPRSEDNRPTRQSDCYALGMVIYEVGSHASKPIVASSRLMIT